MFDNAKPTAEPEDIFESADTGVAPPPTATTPNPSLERRGVEVSPPSMARPSMMSAPAPAYVPSAEVSGGGGFPWKGIVVFIVILGVIGGAAALSYMLLSARTPSTPGIPDITDSVLETPEPTPSPAPAPAPAPTPAPAFEPPPPTITNEPDQDADGLSDAQEAQLGTSPISPDTDADALFDAEEVNVYHTNPLNPDTDGDTFMDGSEVQNGYNPNGPGKLTRTPGAS